MHILYVSHFFLPELGAPVARVSELSHLWAKQGHRVSVLTGYPHYPTGVVPSGYRRRLWRLTMRERMGGVDVVRTWVLPSPVANTRRRMLSYGSFFVSACLRSVFLARPDVVVATSPHLLVGLAGWWISRVRRCPLVFEVRDLWPESLTGGGVAAAGSPVIAGLQRIADFLYDRADLIVPVTDAQGRYIEDRCGVSPERIAVITNGIDETIFRPLDQDACRAALDLPRDRFIVSYIGALSHAQNPRALLEVAAPLREQLPRALLLIVGDGAYRADLARQIHDERHANVRLLPLQSRDRVPQLINASDLCVVNAHPAAVFATVMPVKLLEYMSCGKAVVLATTGYAQEVVERSRCGVAVRAGDTPAFVRAVVDLEKSSETRRSMGEKGRAFALQHFRRADQARRYLGHLQRLAAPVRGRSHPSPGLP